MKKSRIILTVLLVLMIGIAWLQQVNYLSKQEKEFHNLVAEADECYEKMLYQKSIILYEDALKIKEKEEIRDKWLNAYEKAFEKQEITDQAYVQALETEVAIYSKRTDAWKTLIQNALDKMVYQDAKNYYEDAIKSGVSKEDLREYKNSIYYAVSDDNNVYMDVIMSAQGYFTVYDGDHWGIVDPQGTTTSKCTYEYVAPVTDGELYLLTTQTDTKIYDRSRVAQSILSQEIQGAKGINDGIIPLCENGVWRFYNYVKEEYLLDKYEDVSGFYDGKAVVKTDMGWNIIDKEGKKLNDTEFEDVKMLATGEFIYDDMIVASIDGQYGMFHSTGEKKNSFTALDMDNYLGGNVAFKAENGEWGFVDVEGNVVIEPIYEDAKSYSNGLAAVKKDGKWGFIDENGELVIDCTYYDGGYFTKYGVCMVGLAENQQHIIKLRFKSS